jgi:hypothetical protein
MRRCRNCKKNKLDSEFRLRRTWCDGCVAESEVRRSTPEAISGLNRRFDAKVAKTSAWWEWTAAKTDKGYGQIGVDGRYLLRHRLAYERYVGPIPTPRQIDHLCRNHACVNPHHLEAVSRKENVRRRPAGRRPSVR